MMITEQPKLLLLVEDEAIIAMSTQRQLASEGYRVLHAFSGEEAVRLASESREPVDLVLMDINLGRGMDGTQAAQAILQTRDIPILFLSSHTENEVVAKTEAITSYGYVVKNSGPTVLLASIRMAFKLHQANRRIREAEHQQRLYANQLNVVLKISQVGYIDWDVEGNTIRWSEEAYRLYDRDPASFAPTPRNTVEMVHPDDRALVEHRIQEALAGQREYDLVHRVRLHNGRTLEVHAQGEVHFDDQGRAQRMLVAINDITARKEAEEALRRSEEYQKALIACSPIPILSTDLEGRVVSWNPRAEAILGWSAQEVIGQPLPLVPPDKQEEFTRLKEIAWQSGFTNREIVRRKKDGSLFTACLSTAPIQGLTGEPIGIMAAVEDITARKRSEAALQESEERFRAMVEGAPDAIFIQTEQKFAYLNPRALDLFGAREPSEMLGQPVFERFHPDYHARIIERIKRLNEERQAVYEPLEQVYLRLDGSQVWVETSAQPIVYQEKPGALVFVRDVSERKLAERELHEREESYRTTLESIGDGVIATDALGRVTRINPVAEALTGWSRSEAYGQPLEAVFRIINEYTREPVENPVEKVLREGLVVGLANHTLLLAKDGVERPIADSGAPIHNDRGEVSGVVLVFRDQSEERERAGIYASFFENNHAVMLLIDPSDGAIVDANPAAARYYGWTAAELRGMKISAINTLSPAEVQREMQAAADEKRNYFLFRHRRADGSLRDVEVYSGPIAVSGRRLLYSIIHDITARKQADRELALREEKYNRIFHQSPVALALSTLAEGRYVDVNPEYERLLGYTRAELVGHTSLGLDLWVDPNQREDMVAKFRRDGMVRDYAIGLKTKSGRPIQVLWSAGIVEINGAVCILGSVQDISNTRQIQHSLSETNAQLHLALDAAKAGIWEWDLKTQENTWSKEIWPLYGLDPNVAKASYGAWLESIQPQDREKVSAIVGDSSSRGEELLFEWRVRLPAGQERWIMSRGQPVKDECGQVERYRGVVIDITERKRAEEMAHSLLREKELLLREVHHRVINNMSAISNLLDMQIETQTEPSARTALHEAAARLQSMLMLYTKLYRAEIFNAVSLKDYIPALLHEILTGFPHQTPVELQTHIADIVLDPKWISPLGIILNELTTNTLKYAFAPEDQGLIQVTAEKTEDRVTIRYEDNGIGLPETFSFQKAAGFGSHLVWMLVQQINGSITVEQGSGARFAIQFNAV